MSSLPTSCLIKIPRQKRSRELVHAVLDASILVLEREGADGFNTNLVAEAAGVSVGSLYQYFSNKDMLLAGVVARGVLAADEIVHGPLAAADSLPPDQMLRQMATLLLATFEPYRDLLHEILSMTPLMSRSGIMAILETRLTDAVTNYLVYNQDRYRIRGGSAGLYAAVNGAIFVGLKWLAQGPARIDREQLVEALVALTSQLLVDVE